MAKEKVDTMEIEIIHLCEINNNHLQISSELGLLINGITPYDKGDILDFEMLKMSLKIDGDYFLFNCSCGIPQCAGYSEGIRTSSNDFFVYWEDLDGGNKWMFEKEILVNQIDHVKQQIDQCEKYFYQNKGSYLGLK